MYKFFIFYVLPPYRQDKKIPVIQKNKTKTYVYDSFYSMIYDDLFYLKERYKYEASIINSYLKSNFYYIDLCTGTGSSFEFLNSKNVIGIDKSLHMLQKAADKNKTIMFYKADINNISYIEPNILFDGIGCFYFGLFYNKNWEEILYKLKQKVKINGYLFISVLDKNNLEVYYKKIKYKDDILYYSGEYERANEYPFIIRETIQTSIYKLVYRHVMYNPSFTYFEFICKKIGYKIIKKIKYERFSCGDEYLFILKNTIY